jgi:uncharacterized protein (DUF1800 family)
MGRSRGALGLLAGGLLLQACSTAGPSAPAVTAARLALPPSPLSERERILHVLDRLGYGPRPGDVERVRRIGLATYIDQQLHPDRIPDAAVAERLREYPTLALGTTELIRAYPQPEPRLLQRIQSGELAGRELAEVFPPSSRPARVLAELQAAKLIRAVSSPRQLEEVMVDFWFNHFNVFAQKGAVRWMVTGYERDVIRPHALGRFRDLVEASARHPAMLFYLDNWLSVRPDFVVARGPNLGRRAGLNENYARELMELHTLGVDGGYTQQDVMEVARCFTGWTIDRPQVEGTFAYRPGAHDRDGKRVLGHVIPAGGGEGDGLRVIEILVRHPSTARFVAGKLARRFVSDDPPAALVERAARTFLDSDGDIRAVLATIFTSPEFFSAAVYRAKIKTPLELVVSAVRALDGDVAGPGSPAAAPAADPPLLPGGAYALARAVAGLGQPLYEAQPPTGHPDVAEAWVNTGALVRRMNFALRLAGGRLPGVSVEVERLSRGADRRRPDEVLDRLLAALLHGRAGDATRAVLVRQLRDPEITRRTSDDRGPADTDVAKLAALVLGSPEFQRR